MVTTIIGSWRNWQTRHVQTVQIGVRIPASRPFIHPSVAELAYAVGSNPTERIGLKSRVHVGSNPTAGTILRGT